MFLYYFFSNHILNIMGGGPYGVNLYGVKPPLNTLPDCTKLTDGDNTTTCIYPFNASQWSQY